MAYDPRECGADCDACVLLSRREGPVVPPELNHSTETLIVGEAPGHDECVVGRPFVGNSGAELMRALGIHGYRRSDFSITNTLLCLHPNTKVWTEYGKDVRIADLVQQRYDGRIWSINENGAPVLAPVIGWHKTPLANRPLLKLTSTRARRNLHGLAGPVLTAEHSVLTEKRGWVAVQDLQLGEGVATADRRPLDEGIIVGSMLGDATVDARGTFAIRQTASNVDYVQCKAAALAALGRHDLSFVHTDKMRAAGTKQRADLRFCNGRFFHELRDRFYPHGVKIVPRDIVLSDAALAVWFLDDGDLRLREGRLQRGSFATCCFEKDDVEWLVVQLRALGMEDAHATWHAHWKGGDFEKKGYWRIALGPIGVERLAVRIARFVPESMQYKLPLFHRGKFDARAWTVIETAPYYDKSEVHQYVGSPPSSVYCLDVAGTHNFIVGGGFVVHNCRPPGNELARLLYQWRGENKRRLKLNAQLKEGEEPYKLLPNPLDCCAKRLRREIVQFKHVIALGDTAYKATCGQGPSLTTMRGSPHEGWFTLADGFIECDTTSDETRRASALQVPEGAHEIKIVPTFHPAFVLRARRWTHVFRIDLGRAMRWFYGRLNWCDPEVVIRPTPAQLRAFLAAHSRYAWDLETDSKEALTARLRVFGVGTTRKVMVVPFLSTDGHTKFYTESDLAELQRIFVEFLESRAAMKCGWNSINYDSTVVRALWGCRVRRNFDGILAHHDVESELPHKLGFVGTEMTDVPAWKQKSEDPVNCDDATLWHRNYKDVAVTAALVEPLERELVLREQAEVCRKDHRIQEICAGMHRLGMLIDPATRNAHDAAQLRAIVANRKICRDILGNPKFNPNSTAQIAEVLFEKWGLPPVKVSETTGAPSTDDDALRAYRVQYNLDDSQKRFVEALRKVRLAVKLRGTNTSKFRPMSETIPYDPWAEDIEETAEEREYRRKKDVAKHGILHADGRVHSVFTAHVASTGRLASSSPALQNIKLKLRDMFVAAPGHVFVGADADQLELRFAAGRWRMQNMLAILREGRDPHHETALACFGHAAAKLFAEAQAWAKAQSPKPAGKKVKAKEYPPYNRVRDFSKRLRYAVQYGAEDKTVHDVISSTEDDNGNLIYADVSLTETATRRRRLLDADPEYEHGWEEEVGLYRKQGYLREWIWGRRRDFLDGEEFNEIVNFEIQAGCSALIHDATFELVDAIPFEKWGPGTGLVHQGHDALMIECPEADAKWVAGVLVECMTRTYPGLDVQFKAGAVIGKNWLDTK